MRFLMFKRLSFFVLTFLFVVSLPGLPNLAQARALPDFVPLIEQNKDAVVNITTTRTSSSSPLSYNQQGIPPEMLQGPFGEMFKDFFGQQAPKSSPNKPNKKGQPRPHSTGSGFIISKDGYVITNNHVVEGADEITVRLNDRNEYVATLVGTDAMSDIALLKLDAKNLPIVSLGRSKDAKVGEWVVAIGSPFGFDYSVTSGIISALGRSLPKDNYVPFIQTDVAINPGNSGGPLFNLDGEVVGVNSQIYSRTGGFMGLSFAIPIDVAMEVVAQLKKDGKVSRGWLGVYIQEVTRELADSFGMKTPKGSLVTQVIKDSPAEKGGIESGDVILEFNGSPIRLSSDLPPLVGRVPVDSKATVKLLRNGKAKSLRIKIGKLPSEEKLAEQSEPKSEMKGEKLLGMQIETPDAELKDAYNLGGNGVVVTGIESGAAANAGVKSGDVITRVNNLAVRNVRHFKEIIAKSRKGSRIALLIQRQQGPVYLALRIP